MAYYRAEMKRISRTSGGSSVAAAAYRLGDRLKDERTGEIHDYTRKRGVEASGTLLPKDAPDWDAERLWNEAEKKEKRADSLLAKEFECAIPRELDEQQRRELTETFIREEINSRGLAASYGIHRTPASDGGDNPHVHIQITTRQLHENGFDAKKDQFIAPTSGAKKKGQYVADEALETFRERWEHHTNEALCAAGSAERVDCRSYEDQGVNKKPGVHLGKDAWHMEQKGIRTRLGDHVRTVNFENHVRGFIADSDSAPAPAAASSDDLAQPDSEWSMATGKGKRQRMNSQDRRDMNRTGKAETVISNAALTEGYTNRDFFDRMDKLRDKAVEDHEERNRARETKNAQTEKSFQEAVERSRTKRSVDKQREPEL
jgi:hypothetical protein